MGADRSHAIALLKINLHAASAPSRRCCRRCSRRATARSASWRSSPASAACPKLSIYGASKAALINFTETLYLDLHPKGFGVYLINPGFVKTPLTDSNEFKMPHLITPRKRRLR